MSKKHYKLQTVFGLNEFSEQVFVLKLKKTNPNITKEEIKKLTKEWMLDRPLAPHGDGEGVIGDLSRFSSGRKSQ